MLHLSSPWTASPVVSILALKGVNILAGDLQTVARGAFACEQLRGVEPICLGRDGGEAGGVP